MRRSATSLEESPTGWRLVITAAACALAGGRATAAGRAAAVAKGKLTLSVSTAVIKAKLIAVLVVFGEAPCAAAIFPKHPHVEGRDAVVLEVEGAPPAQATRAGKRLPATGQGHVPGGGNFDPDPRSLAATAVSLQPEAIKASDR